jgi:acylphosphatase
MKVGDLVRLCPWTRKPGVVGVVVSVDDGSIEVLVNGTRMIVLNFDVERIHERR